MSTPALSPQELEKQQAAAAAVRWVHDGMVLGLGTGTTSAHFIKQLGERVQAGLKVQGTATSLASEALAREVGIPLIEPMSSMASCASSRVAVGHCYAKKPSKRPRATCSSLPIPARWCRCWVAFRSRWR
jgi:hypothetical protein